MNKPAHIGRGMLAIVLTLVSGILVVTIGYEVTQQSWVFMGLILVSATLVPLTSGRGAELPRGLVAVILNLMWMLLLVTSENPLVVLGLGLTALSMFGIKV